MGGKLPDNKAITPALQDAFLAAIRLFPNITEAAKAVGCHRSSHYEWLKSDPDYAERFRDAMDEGLDTIEKAAIDLATGKLSKKIVSAGKVLGEEPVYSERMIEMLLRAHRPDRYRDRSSHEITGKDGGAVRVEQEVSPDFVAKVLAELDRHDVPDPGADTA